MAEKSGANMGKIAPDDAWLALLQEEILEPDLPIIDPHHHLWMRNGYRYLIPEFMEDAASGHNIVSTVFAECHSMYRPDGPEAEKPLGETDFITGCAAMAANGAFGPAKACAAMFGRGGHDIGRSGAAPAGTTPGALRRAVQGRALLHRLGCERAHSKRDAQPARIGRPRSARGCRRSGGYEPDAGCLALSSAAFGRRGTGGQAARSEHCPSTMSAVRSWADPTATSATRCLLTGRLALLTWPSARMSIANSAPCRSAGPASPATSPCRPAQRRSRRRGGPGCRSVSRRSGRRAACSRAISRCRNAGPAIRSPGMPSSGWRRARRPTRSGISLRGRRSGRIGWADP